VGFYVPRQRSTPPKKAAGGYDAIGEASNRVNKLFNDKSGNNCQGRQANEKPRFHIDFRFFSPVFYLFQSFSTQDKLGRPKNHFKADQKHPQNRSNKSTSIPTHRKSPPEQAISHNSGRLDAFAQCIASD
jgi:hypothetical protein